MKKIATTLFLSSLFTFSCGEYKDCKDACDLGLELPKNPSKAEIITCIDNKIDCLQGEYLILKSESRRLDNQSSFLSMDIDNSNFHDSRLAMQHADEARIEMARIQEEIESLKVVKSQYLSGKRR